MNIKRLFIEGVAISSLLLCGCSKNADSSQKTEINVWHVLPQIEVSQIKNLIPFSYQTVRSNELEAVLVENQEGFLNQAVKNGYTDDAILLQKDDVQMIYDFHGNLLYEMPDKVSDTFLGEGICTCLSRKNAEDNYFTISYGALLSNGKAVLLNDTFTGITEIDAGNMIAHPYDGNQVFDEIAVQKDTIGILHHLKNSEGEDANGYGFQEYNFYPQNLFLAENISSSCKKEGQVVIDSGKKVLSKVSSVINTKTNGQFVNGYYSAYQKDEKKKMLAIVDAKSGKEITEYKYKDTGYFENGYCPVENESGKWAYINEKGEEVTEFIFDGASSLYEGKAWVMHEGKAGVINLQASENGKLAESIFQLSTSDEPVIYEKTDQNENAENGVIGQVKINIASLNIRNKAGMDGEKTGYAQESQTYDVYEKSDADGYTWYRIGENQWIAGNQEWVTYTEK